VLTVTGKGARVCTVVPVLCCPITKGCDKNLAPPLVPGTVALKFAAIEKKKRKLQSTGKVKVTPTFTFTPNDGTPFSISQTMKLKKKKK
jgi:hypothetical protein